MRIWIDIENPPQVQYLLPFKPAFEEAGAEVTVTARDYDVAFDLLRARGVEFQPVGASYGKGKVRKVVGLAGRTRALASAIRRGPRPLALVCNGRAAPLAARLLGVRPFVIEDYEFSHEGVHRVAGSYIVHPEAIDPEVFRRQGIRADRLISFPGIKEDLSFAGIDVEAVPPHVFPQLEGSDLVKVLFRPPAEEAHYHREESAGLALQILERLAAQEETVVVYSARYPRQVEYLRRFRWVNEPVVLDRVVPFVSLLRGVDAVVSGGGTMLREAAYLGVPAYSTFQGELGGVDRHLAAMGRVHLVNAPERLDGLPLVRAQRQPMMRSDPALLREIARTVLERAGAGAAVAAA
jgi:predicted glycosyltransferase